MNSNTVRQSIVDCSQKKIEFAAFMRSVLSYDEWRVPIQTSDDGKAKATEQNVSLQLFPQHDGRVALRIFVDDVAANQYRNAHGYWGKNSLFLTARGRWLLSNLRPQIDIVEFIGGKDEILRYYREQVVRLRQWAQIALVESALDSLSQKTWRSDVMRLLREFDGYHVVTWRGIQPPPLPQHPGKKLLPVCTAEDTLNSLLRVLAQTGIEHDQLSIRRQNGSQLFSSIRSGVEGVIFNPAGPIAPTAFLPSVASYVLDGF
jgi:hypothetical protein